MIAATRTMSTGMTQPSRRPRRRSPRIGSRGNNRPMPDRPPAAGRWVALAAPASVDRERRIHPTQVVALEVAVHDVVAWRQAQVQRLAVVDVKALGLVDQFDAECFFVDRQPVALQRQLVRGAVGSYDDELVGGRALIADVEADGAGGHNGRVLPDLEVLEEHVHGGAAGRGRLPAGHGEGDRERERGQHKRERPRPAPPRPSPRHPVYLLQMARTFTRSARTPSVTLERIRPAAKAASSTSGSRRLSSIQLLLEDTTAGSGSSGKGAIRRARA